MMTIQILKHRVPLGRSATVLLALGTSYLCMAVLPSALAAGAGAPTERANALLAQMTREEKIAFAASGAAGVPRLGIPGQVFGDGPNGVGHGEANVTAFPNAEVVAATWDTTLADRFGSALATDLVLSGRWMPAAEAHTRGVVREVVTADNLQAAAQQIAVTLGKFDAHAYAADKALLNRTLKADLAAAIETSAEFHGHGKH